ncbi:MAG: glycosyltransferase family 39 protein [Bacteroidetes bacterium]|nr:glycosyltransferase family 39 protein [Bacteroidota bacterium]
MILSFLKKYYHLIILFTCLIVYTLVRYKDLFLPYFWDEMAVYSRAAMYLNDHNLSILPSALTPLISRGHPILFAFLHGSAMRIFGTDLIVGHTVSLIFSFSLVLVLYYVARSMLNKTLGLIAALTLMAQPIFIGQSMLMLPEILLAMLVLLAAHFYLREKWVGYIIACSIAVMIKETAVLIPVVAGLYGLLIRIRSLNFKYVLTHVLVNLVPAMIFGLFLIVQKIQHGFYLFPFHMKMLAREQLNTLAHIYNYLEFIFIEQGRFLISLFILAGLSKMIFQVYKKTFRTNIQLRNFILFSLILFITMIIFSGTFGYMNRYMTLLIPLLAILGVMSLNYISGKINFAKIGLALSILVIPFFYLETSVFDYEVDLGYKRHLNVLKRAVRYLEEEGLHDQQFFTNFPVNSAIKDVRRGYLSGKYDFKPSRAFDDHTTYVVISRPGSASHNFPGDVELESIKIFRDKFAQVEIFKVIRPEMRP